SRCPRLARSATSGAARAYARRRFRGGWTGSPPPRQRAAVELAPGLCAAVRSASAAGRVRQFSGYLREPVQHLGVESALYRFGLGDGEPGTPGNRMVIASGEPDTGETQFARGQRFDVAGSVYVDHPLEPPPVTAVAKPDPGDRDEGGVALTVGDREQRPVKRGARIADGGPPDLAPCEAKTAALPLGAQPLHLPHLEAPPCLVGVPLPRGTLRRPLAGVEGLHAHRGGPGASCSGGPRAAGEPAAAHHHDRRHSGRDGFSPAAVIDPDWPAVLGDPASPHGHPRTSLVGFPSG